MPFGLGRDRAVREAVVDSVLGHRRFPSRVVEPHSVSKRRVIASSGRNSHERPTSSLTSSARRHRGEDGRGESSNPLPQRLRRRVHAYGFSELFESGGRAGCRRARTRSRPRYRETSAVHRHIGGTDATVHRRKAPLLGHPRIPLRGLHAISGLPDATTPKVGRASVAAPVYALAYVFLVMTCRGRRGTDMLTRAVRFGKERIEVERGR